MSSGASTDVADKATASSAAPSAVEVEKVKAQGLWQMSEEVTAEEKIT